MFHTPDPLMMLVVIYLVVGLVFSIVSYSTLLARKVVYEEVWLTLGEAIVFVVFLPSALLVSPLFFILWVLQWDIWSKKIFKL